MAVVVEMQNTGDAANRSEIVASIEHTLCEEPGDWRISIVGSRGSDDWEMQIEGPRGFERRYTLAVSAGEHQPEVICVGRAGRRDGNALTTTLAEGNSPHDLYFFEEVLDMISGEVTTTSGGGPAGVSIASDELALD